MPGRRNLSLSFAALLLCATPVLAQDTGVNIQQTVPGKSVPSNLNVTTGPGGINLNLGGLTINTSPGDARVESMTMTKGPEIDSSVAGPSVDTTVGGPAINTTVGTPSVNTVVNGPGIDATVNDLTGGLLGAVPAPALPSPQVPDLSYLNTSLQVTETADGGLLVNLPGDVLFDFDQDALRPDARATIREVAELIEAQSPAGITVIGHTDAKGSDRYNFALSERRAGRVAEALALLTGREDMVTRGAGETQPVAPNAHPDGADDPSGRQLNRRVEILLR